MQKNIYIMISQTGTSFSRIFQLFTHAPYNHASIALDENLNSLYSFARKRLHMPFIAGFVKENINQGIYKIHDNTVCNIYCFSVSKQQYEDLKNAIQKFENNQDKYSYNFAGLLPMLFNVPLNRQHHYVCSQFVAYILYEANVLNLNKHFSLVRPYDFSELSELNLIYSGKLSDYTA